nr:SMC-Scp complex subunit ScpB [Actinoplanes subtropicus]
MADVTEEADQAEIPEVTDVADEPEDDERPDGDEERSEAGLSEDDDDFDETFEGTNPPGYFEHESEESEMSAEGEAADEQPVGAEQAVGAEEPGPGVVVPEPSGGAAVPEQGRRAPRDVPAVVAGLTRTSEELLDLADDDELCAALEAILLVVDEPVAEMQLAQILEQPTERVGVMLENISARYTAAGHGFDLRRAAGGWRLYTRPEYAAYVERFVLDGQSVRLTQAALETLAVVAYKQPVTRSRISAIRGVNCDGVMRTLATRGLIEECGVESETGAYLYRTTPLFLEKLGINSVDQLPPLAPFLPDDVEEVLDAPG